MPTPRHIHISVAAAAAAALQCCLVSDDEAKLFSLASSLSPIPFSLSLVGKKKVAYILFISLPPATRSVAAFFRSISPALFWLTRTLA